jgi:arylsulfatase A-like enzyme
MYLPTLNKPASRVAEVVETKAIYATILDLLGLRPRSHDAGETLLPLMMPEMQAGLAPDEGREAYTEVWLPENHIRMSGLRTAEWKLMLDHERNMLQLFDLRNDPREVSDVSASHPETLLELRDRLEGWLARMPAEGGATRELSPRDIERLRALGYVR